MTDRIQFLLNKKLIELSDFDPNTTVLNYIRDHKNLRGTKEGCGSGDCGACTAVIAELDGKNLKYRSINTCIMFLYSLQGKQLITVENLEKNKKLHPTQQSMVDNNGSQCGFCTPGFIMSMFAMYKNKEQTSKENIDKYLAGNLCRCTGYKPINLATKNMYSYGRNDHFAEKEKEVIKKLTQIKGKNISIEYNNKKYFITTNIAGLKNVIKNSNNYKLLSGGTDLALEVTKKRKDIETLIYLGNNKDLKYIKIKNKKIIIGAATPINDTLGILNKYYPEIAEMYLRYGSLQIRNVATIGGNLANASPIGDSAPALISLDSSIVINGKNKKTVKLNNFFLNYKKTLLKKNEFIQEIIIPIKKEVIFKCYKISKRFDDDISAVFMAITLKLKNTTIENILITLGGMAEIPKRAEKTEKFLKGKKLNLDNIILAQSIIIKEFTPLSDMRASSDYRKKICQNLLEKFYYETINKNKISVNK